MRRLFPTNTFVAPSGTGKVLAIAEAPGEDEQFQGVPLVGGAGRWFDSMCRKAGLRRSDLTLCNVINCRPPKNVFPTDPEAKSYITPQEADQAVAHCLNAHVLPLLKSTPWRKVLLLGDKALEFIAGKHEGVFKWRGSPLPIPALDPKKPIAIPTLHPAYIARDQEFIPVVVNDLAKNPVPPPEHYTSFPTIEEVRAFTAEEFAFDIETNRWTQEIKMVGFSDKAHSAICIPFRGPYLPELKRIFANAKSVVGHNSLQFDLPILRKHGVTIGADCVSWDTMLLQHLCFPTLPHDLEFLGSQFTNKPAWKHEKGVEEVYCCRDVDVTWQCFKQLLPLVRREGLLDLYHLTQVPLAKLCHDMQVRGFKVDAANIPAVREKLLAQMAVEETFLPEPMRAHEVPVSKREPAPPGTLSAKTGKPLKFILTPSSKRVVPWRSPTEKIKFLYSDKEPWCLNLDTQFDPKSGSITTGKNAIDRLTRRSETPEQRKSLQALKNLNKWDELITTFVNESRTAATGRQHPHFNVHGTASGRLSSSDPNLQNIPAAAKFMYVPTHPGWKLLYCDYSGIENRLTAFFAGDHERLDRFMSIPGFSEHKYAAALFMGIPYAEVEKSDDPESPYQKAKRIVHGTNYGEGSKKIALVNDLDLKEVKELHAKWKDTIRATITWQNLCAERAKTDGYLTTPFGRRRWFYTSSYYTESLSFLPQSTAADVIFRAMIALMYERIALPIEKAQRIARLIEPLPKPAELLLTVHDSLIFEYPPDIERQLVSTVKRVMEQPWPELGGMSFPIGIETGPSWGELEDYDGPIDA